MPPLVGPWMHPALSALGCSSHQLLTVRLTLSAVDCSSGPRSPWVPTSRPWHTTAAYARHPGLLPGHCHKHQCGPSAADAVCNSLSESQTATQVCCPLWHQGRSDPLTPRQTWSSKHADRRTGEASEGDTVLKLCPSHEAQMALAVDCPTIAVGPIAQTASAHDTPCCSMTLQAKCCQRACHSTVFLSSGAAHTTSEPCCSAVARQICRCRSQLCPSVSRQKNLYSLASDWRLARCTLKPPKIASQNQLSRRYTFRNDVKLAQLVRAQDC